MPPFTHGLTLLIFSLLPLSLAAHLPSHSKPAASIKCNSKPYIYNSLAGFGYISHDARDSYGDTLSIGSSIAVPDWEQTTRGGYKGTLYALPDRGWNTNGTTNTQPRIHIFDITFTPSPEASVKKPAGPNLKFKYKQTILLTGPDRNPLTSLDPDQDITWNGGGLKYAGFPVLPTATYPPAGDGFSASGDLSKVTKRVSLDAEGLVLNKDGSFWISDEYGPAIYKFDPKGKMIDVIQPPDAFLPLRNDAVSYTSYNPPIYDPNRPPPAPEDPTQGRQNNQGFEGLTASPDGKYLYAMLQSALIQDGGSSSSKRQNTRLLKYEVSPGKKSPTLAGEYVVPLPTYVNAEGKTRVAAQSEIHFISETQLLVLPRDSDVGRGYGPEAAESKYRHVDVFDISKATDIKGRYDRFNKSVTVGNECKLTTYQMCLPSAWHAYLPRDNSRQAQTRHKTSHFLFFP